MSTDLSVDDEDMIVRFIRGFIAEQALGGSKEGRLNLTPGRGQVANDLDLRLVDQWAAAHVSVIMPVPKDCALSAQLSVWS